MAWAWWLSVPVGATLLAALGTWIAGLLSERRTRRPRTPAEAMIEHQRYLHALAAPAHASFRVERPDVSLGEVSATFESEPPDQVAG